MSHHVADADDRAEIERRGCWQIWRHTALPMPEETSAPGGTRTPGRLLRRQLLYPAELQALLAHIVPDSGRVSDTAR